MTMTMASQTSPQFMGAGSSWLSQEQAAESILQEVAANLGYNAAFVLLGPWEPGALGDAFGVNVPGGLVKAQGDGSPWPMLESEVARSVRQQEPLLVDDALQDPDIPEERRTAYLEAGLHSLAVVPLPPLPGALVVAADRPLAQDDLIAMYPYVCQLVAVLWDRQTSRHQRVSREDAARESWLHLMLDSIPDPVVIADEGSSILYRNTHADRLLRSSPEDAEGKRRAVDLNNLLLSTAFSSFALGQGTGPGLDFTLVDPVDGSELLFEIICTPVVNPQTGEHGMACVLRNVTDLHQAVQELQNSLFNLRQAHQDVRAERDRLNQILESAVDPIIVSDLAGDPVLMNPSAERLLKEPEDQQGQTTAPYYTNSARLTSLLLDFRLSGEDVRWTELEMVDPETQDPLVMSATATTIRDDLGQVSAVVLGLHDLTQVKELERRKLERQLFESEKLAAVGRLAASVAHEINNPLEAVKNAVYLVASSAPADMPDRRFLDIAARETERVSRIIRQILGLYRPETQKGSVDINALIEEAVALLQKQLGGRSISIQTDLDRSLPPVQASADQLRQVFLNLLLNAADAMESEGMLHVATRAAAASDATPAGEGNVAIEVQDSGKGIAQEDLEHIFEPFFSTKQERKGAGLGLWVCHDILQQHDGRIDVKSQIGQGSTFTVTLPIGEEE